MTRASEADILGALKQALERAAAAEAELADNTHHIAVLAHELRTAIGGVISISGLLAGSSLDDMQRKQVVALQQSGLSLLRLVNNVLDNAKLKSARMSLDPVDADIDAFVADLADGLSARAALKGLKTAVSIDAPLPAYALVDLIRLKQVTDNLVDNAVKFTAEGGVQLLISFEEHSAETGTLHIAVCDTGMGLSEDERARLFRPFIQADNTIARRFGGSGLGLVIVKQLVDLMGGRIDVNSEPGAGSTFSLAIPLNGVRWVRSKEISPDQALTGKTPRPVHVLIVEDNSVNQFLISALLENFGMTFQIAGGGREGIGAYKRGRFDVVLMDIQMPVVDGFEATRAIRQHQKTNGFTPIIALSAQTGGDIREASSDNLFDCHVAKPIEPARLAQAINAALQSVGEAASA